MTIISDMSNPGPVAVLVGAFLSGAMMSLFLITIPVLLGTSTSAKHLLSQWNLIFSMGHTRGPSIAIAVGVIHAFTAWSLEDSRFVIAGLITISMIPYTWIVMRNVNNALFAASEWAEEAKEENNEGVRQLVNAWSRFNAVRALFPLAGAVYGMFLLWH